MPSKGMIESRVKGFNVFDAPTSPPGFPEEVMIEVLVPLMLYYK